MKLWINYFSTQYMNFECNTLYKFWIKREQNSFELQSVSLAVYVLSGQHYLIKLRGWSGQKENNLVLLKHMLISISSVF